MVESDSQSDVWAGLGAAIEAFEQGLEEYQTQLHAWSQDRLQLLGRETAMAEERTSVTARGLEERAQQLARDQEALAQDKAGLERDRAELDALVAECERRDRLSREREASLGQKFSSHEQVAESIEERTRQLVQREREQESKFGRMERDLAERRSVLASVEKKLAEQRQKFDHDNQELVRFRDELARRESELTSQSSVNQEAQQELALLRNELDTRQSALAGEDEAIAKRRGQVDRRTEELSSLQSVLQARQAEIESRTHALESDSHRLKQQSDALAKRERELEQATAKSIAKHQKAALDLERREKDLADASLALSERAEGLETGQLEIKAHRFREQELAETQKKIAKQQALLEEADHRLRAAEQALKDERDELAATRKSVEADLDAKRQESARKEAEALTRREQVERDSKSVEQQAQSLERRSVELERQSKMLAEREGELNKQQARLEAALQNLHNDQDAIEKAHKAITEVDDSRWNELNNVRAELNAMRTEIELARAHERELEGALGKVQATSAREMHAAENARTKAARLSEQLEEERRTAAGQRAAIFAECLIAAGLKGPSADGEHEVLALLEGVKAKSAGQGQLLAADLKGSSAAGALVVSSPNDSSQVNNSPSASRGRRLTGLPPDGGTLLVQQQASHMAVATFWTDFKLSPAHLGPVAVDPKPTNTGMPDTTAEASPTATSQDVEVQEFASEEEVDSQASAMRMALAAARAEVEAAKHNEPQAARSGPKTKSPSSGKKRKAADVPIQLAQEAPQKPAPELVAKQPAAVLASIDLDPETANKLRMLRRLNPTKSDQELLARISSEGKSPGKAKRKKGWFALK